MIEEITEREGESSVSERLNPEIADATRLEAARARGAANAASFPEAQHDPQGFQQNVQHSVSALIPKCITDKKYTLAAAVIFTVLIIIIISLAARKPQPCPVCPPPVDVACPDYWVGYQGKCYYRSESESNWNSSAKNCSLLGASLAVIDTKQDLDFLMNFAHPLHYWIGLSREAGQAWRWPNGTEFKNHSGLSVRGEGDCAYINNVGLSSTRCSTDNLFLCSQEDACVRRRKERDGL